MTNSNEEFWLELYRAVYFEGDHAAPRGRKTIYRDNYMYITKPGQHFDENPVRNINPDYIFREFLWFLTGDRFDTRMAAYAPIWKTCVDAAGGINSNYGQYFFESYSGMMGAFFRGLDVLAADNDSRRCWLSIFQEFHQQDNEHTDYPCTTGMGFTIRNGLLHMTVHMRSQDLWWGAANDQPVCFLLQLLAQAYLRWFKDVDVGIGPIVHYIDNLHFYERHWDKALAAILTFEPMRPEIEEINDLFQQCFSMYDVCQMFQDFTHFPEDWPREYSPMMHRILSIPGEYGYEDSYRSW